MTTPTQGEHAQTEALRLADALYDGSYLLSVERYTTANELRHLHAKNEALIGGLKKANEQAEHFEREWYLRGDEIEALHAQVAALTPAPECLTCNDHGAVGNILTAEPCPDCTPAQPAAPQGVAYAELPEHCFVAFERLYSANQMRDFADRTHALRASNGQAPAGAAQQAPAGVRYVVSAVVIKETSFGFNTQNKLYCVSAASPEEAHGMVLPQLSQDFPEHRLHTLCHWVIEPTTAQAAPAAVAGVMQFGGCPECGSRSCVARACTRAAPAAGAVAGPDGRMSHELRRMIEGMSVSVDVSTGDHDAGHRYFGTVTEVMDCNGDKHGVTLLVQDAEPNFAPTPPAQADSQPAPQGETNVQLDIDSNPSTPGQHRDMAGSVALGQPMGNGQDQAAGHLGAQGDKLLTVAERNIRSFLRSAVFKSESDREAALSCVDVLRDAARAPADSVTAPAGGANTKTAELLSTTVGLLMGYREGGARQPYRPGSVIAKTVDEVVEHLKGWPYPEPAPPTPPAQAADSVLEDAARWRELREQHEDDTAERCCVFAPNDMRECLVPVGSLPGELDAFIDAERAARKQGGKHD